MTLPFPFLRETPFRALTASVALLLATAGGLSAAPFRPADAAQMRTDFQSNWAGITSVHGTNLPQGFSNAPTTGSTHGIALYTTSARIWNASGRNQSGVLLDNQGPDPVHLYPGRYVQGAAVTIESTQAGPATFKIGIYLGDGNYVAEKTVTVPDGRVPTFLGIIDPETRIGIISISSDTNNRFTISNLTVQDKKVINIDADLLPAAGEFTEVVEPLETYLNQGYGNLFAKAATLQATAENDNVHDLQSKFPTLRPGDVIALERLGSPISGRGQNPLLGVFSSTQELKEGKEYRRVPGAIKTGTDYYTGPIKGVRNVETPSNLQEDFVIGGRTLVVFPGRARYLFLTREFQEDDGPPMSIKVSHIPRKIFEAWVSDQGMAGTLADPASDLDGDGLTLLEEYAFGKDPTVSDASQRTDYSFAPFPDPDSLKSGRLQLLFGVRTDGPIRYAAEFSDDLKIWQRQPASRIEPALYDSNAPRAIFSVIDPDSGPKRFGRLILDFVPAP